MSNSILVEGDRLTREEFHRHYIAMPHIVFETVKQGVATAEHQQFVSELQQRSQGSA